MTVTQAWVAAPRRTTGLDHLGVRAVSEAYYAELVPCVTNVTDRVRNYAFYAWVVWSFEKRHPEGSYEEFVGTFRKAECLMTLAGAAHEQELREEPAVHGEGLPGRFVLLKALKALKEEGIPVPLSRYAGREDNDDRYFLADLGGLRQYYLGTLQELNVLGRALEQGEQLAISPGRGVELAQTYDAHVPGDLFWNAVEADRVDLETLLSLKRFCPCHLQGNEPERTELLDLLLNRDGSDAPDMTDVTVMLLQLLSVGEETYESRGAVVTDFRWRAYSGELSDGERWTKPAVEAWRAYQQHDVLGLAVQALFWTVYDCFAEKRPVAHSSREVGDWFISFNQEEFSAGYLSRTFGDYLAKVAGEAPPTNKLTDQAHERSLCEFLLTDTDASHAALVETVTQLICTLILRLPEGRLYPGLNRDDAYFEIYPVNLRQLRSLASAEWSSLSVREWLQWLIVNWGVGQQHRVALRKLRSSSDETFRLLPTERGLIPQGNVEVTFSNPRLNEALRALQDLGLVDDEFRLTQQGRTLKEELGG